MTSPLQQQRDADVAYIQGAHTVNCNLKPRDETRTTTAQFGSGCTKCNIALGLMEQPLVDDTMLLEAAHLTDITKSPLASAVRKSPLFLVRDIVLQQLAEALAEAGFLFGRESEFRAAALRPLFQKLSLLQSRARIFSEPQDAGCTQHDGSSIKRTDPTKVDQAQTD
jgi:hypothetical protein